MITNTILLQDAAQGGGLSSLIMIVALIAIFYFLKKFREGLQKGDKIITAGGIYGIIKEVKETSFVIEVTDNVKIRIDKNSVYPSAEDAAMSQQK